MIWVLMWNWHDLNVFWLCIPNDVLPVHIEVCWRSGNDSDTMTNKRAQMTTQVVEKSRNNYLEANHSGGGTTEENADSKLYNDFIQIMAEG